MRVQHVFVLVLIMVMLLLSGQPVSLGAESLPTIALDPIDNPDGDGTYTITWREVTSAGRSDAPVAEHSMQRTNRLDYHLYLPLIAKTTEPPYMLQEDDNPEFDSPQVVYTGSLTSIELTDKPEGVYYYRVKGKGNSPWSNHQLVVVHVQSLACQTFVEDFTDTEYRDAENTTADWNTSEGNLRLRKTLLPALPKGLSEMSAVYAPVTGKVYVLGGDDGSYGTQDILEFDPTTGQLSELSANLDYGARRRTSAVYAPETSKIYVFGGEWGKTSTSRDDVIVEFDPVADSVTFPARLPSERSGTSAAYVPETAKAYIFGGRTGTYSRLDEIVEFDPIQGKATKLPAKLPSARYGTSAVYVPETGKVYIFGGYDVAYLDEIIEFDPVTGGVNTLSVKLPTTRRQTSAVYVPGTGKVYVFGGIGSAGAYYVLLDDIIEFDPIAGSVNILSTELPTGRHGTAAACVPETSKVYVFGGSYATLELSEIIQFDPVVGDVDGVGSVNTLLSVKLPTAREGTSATYVPGTGKVYVFGGYGDSGRLDEIVEFDPVAVSINPLSVNLPTERELTSAVYVPGTGKVYIFGGRDSVGGYFVYLNDIVEFDPIAGSVSILSTKLPTGRYGTAAAYVPETSKVYVFGGYDGDEINEVLEFDPATGGLNTLPSVLPKGLSEMSAVYAPVTGKVYVLGGDDGSYGTQDILEFDPTTGQLSELSANLDYGARRRTSAVYAPETSKIYVFGGEWGKTSTSRDDVIVEFDPVADSVTFPARLPSERSGTSAAYVPETAKAYVFGGRHEGGAGSNHIVEVEFGRYVPMEQAQSTELDSWAFGIESATLSADQNLNSQSVTYALSNDGVAIWEDVTLDVEHAFSDTTGSDLRWRALLRGDSTATPVVDRLTIIYCPNRSVPAPAVPFLDPVNNPNADGYYPVTWSNVPGAVAYVLEESQSADFSNPIVAYVGSDTSMWIIRQALGSYYYRVRAWNAGGNGDWSGEQQGTVTQSIAAPALNPIENPIGWSSYVLTWEEIGPGVSYTLQRDVSPSFPSPVTVYEGEDTSSQQSVSDLGTYYYRVRAADNGLESDWSSVQSVEVTELCPESGHYTGEPDVSFDVTADCQVCNFDITVPFGFLQYCRIRPSGCADITNYNFGFAGLELGSIFVITGTFDSPIHALGGYSVSMCEDTLIFPASEGPWDAGK